MRIDSTTSDETLVASLEGKAKLEISPEMSAAELVQLILRLALLRDGAVVAQLVPQHPAATASSCDQLVAAFPLSSSVLNAVATSEKVRTATLEKLRNSRFESVAGHAELALVGRMLPTATLHWLERTLEAHSGDEGVSLGVRQLIASSPAVPTEILQHLVDDEADFIATAAQSNLAGRGHRS